MRKNHIILAVSVIIGAMLACNLPSNTSSNPNQQNPDAVLTAAALTVQAQLSTNNTPTLSPANTATATLSVNTPTFTSAPLPSFTATAQCDLAQFIADVNVPDGTTFAPNATFTKTWSIKNIGSCTWSGYSLVFDHGDPMNGTSPVSIGTVPPGATAPLSVSLQAPASTGNYRSYWRIRNFSGALIPVQDGYQGQSFYVDIKVNGGGGSGPFAVTHVSYTLSTWSDSGHTNCPRVIAAITTNGAGTITYTWMTNSGTNSPATLTFGSAGTQSINYDWALGHIWNGTSEYVGIYIDSPNHQDFGHLSFTTACASP